MAFKLTIFFTIFLSFQLLFQNSINGQINASVEEGCLPLAVNFSSNIENVKNYQWRFSNGQSSSLASPAILFQEVGMFNVELTVTLKNNEVETYNEADFIQVYDIPQAAFTVSETLLCKDAELQFINNSTGAESYLWSFGDGNQSSEESPYYAYNSGGKFTVTLKAIGQGGCENVVVLVNVVEVYEPIEAEISVSNNVQCLGGDPLEFNITGDFTSVLWDFGDGNTSTSLNPEYNYAELGVYNILVSTVDANGCTQNLQLNDAIQIVASDRPEITVSEPTICLGQSVTVEAKVENDGNFLWTLSDGREFEGKNIEIPFDQAGSYDLSLHFTNEIGCQYTTEFSAFVEVQFIESPVFEYNALEGCAPFDFEISNITSATNQNEWKINGETISGNILNYTFTDAGNYTITAITHYENGCVIQKNLEEKVIVHQPITDVVVSKADGCLPFTTNFELGNLNASNIEWLSGDGSSAQGEKADFTYLTSGVFFPKVIYTNQYGCLIEHQLENPITVYDTAITLNDPEVIESCTYTEVQLNGSMGYTSWEWNFGDGNTSTEQNPIHSYSQPGTYTISLTTKNKNGCETTISNYNVIDIPDINPEATYDVTPLESCGLFEVNLQTQLSEGQNAFWYLDEALIATGTNANLSFATLKDVTIILTIRGGGDCSKSKAIMIKNPWTDCEAPDLEQEEEDEDNASPISKHNFKSCTTPFSVEFINPAPGANSVEWTFSDGTKRSDENFTKIYSNPGNYTVDFYARFSSDSSFLVEDYITISIEDPLVDFTYDIQVVCDSFAVIFEPTNPDFEYYNWKVNNQYVNLVNGNTYYFQQAGLYQVSLSASGQNTCEATAIKNIFIGNEEHLFSYINNICVGEELVINQNLSGFQSFSWDLGNGETFEGAQLNYNYTEVGEYQIQLNATDFDNCTHTFALPKKVNVKDPVAQFTTRNSTTGCGNYKVNFVNEATGADKWLWDFGNGITSEEKNPQVTFSPGVYTVTLSVTTGNCTDSIVKEDYIIVEELSSDFSFEADQDCLPVEVQLTSESSNAVAWLWDFGDGNTSILQNPIHIYTAIPEKPIQLTVTNANGCKVSSKKAMNSIFSAQFEAEQTKLCAPGTVQFNALSELALSWQWDFGDGNTSTEANPVHVYQQAGNYSVQLIAGNSTGCADTVYFENYVEVVELRAAFSLAEQINSACVPVQVSFQDESIGASSYEWNFGDGKTSKVADPLHYYTSVGTFDVQLIVTNSLGCKDTLSMPQMVITRGPETSFSIENKNICIPNPARFTDESANAVEWQWFFGDGTTSAEQNPEHIYTSPGNYKVTLIAKNADGCEQSYSIDKIKVRPTPVVDFEISSSGECYPVEVTLNNKSTSLQNAGFLWDFGNGVKSTERNPSYIYTKPGSYQITLAVKNEGACEVVKTHDFVILVRDTTMHKEADVKTVWVEENLSRFEIAPYLQNNISHYNVYRKISNGYRFLNQYSPNRTGVFEDNTCEPQHMSHEYVFQAVSYCEDTVNLQEIKHYNTLYLQKHIEKQGRQMQWNKHIGLVADNYRVFRKSEQQEEWSEIAVSNIATHNFADTTELCPGIYEYKVASFNQNRLLSSSNPIKFEVTDAVFRTQQAEIKTTTVLEEGEVFTEWEVPNAGKSRIAAYAIYRSVNDGNFEFHAEVSPKDQFFIDKDVDSKSNKYDYQVKIINDCSIDAPISDQSNTVLLQKQNQYKKYELNWNPYQGWEEGVLKYIIQKKNENGQWETVMEVSGDTFKAIIDKEDQ